MKKPGVLVYRCRHCGGLNKSAHVPDVRTAVPSIVVSGSTEAMYPQSSTAKMTATHYCGPGRTGVSDLIGGIEDPA